MEEKSFQMLEYQLDNRNKHIIELQSQLLRVDYEYSVIVKNLKKKFDQLMQEKQGLFNVFTHKVKKYKKLLKDAIQENKEHSVKNLRHKEKLQNQNMILSVKYKDAQNEVQNLQRQAKYTDNLIKKNEIKLFESEQKCKHSKKLNEKLELQNKELKKIIQVNDSRVRELEEQLYEEAMKAPEKIQNLKNSLFSQLKMMESLVSRDNNPERKQVVKVNSTRQCDNGWESDLKKLKNGCDFGQKYFQTIESSHFDRAISKQIFLFIRKLIKEKQQLSMKEQKLLQNQPVIQHLKEKMQYFQKQIFSINSQSNTSRTSVASVQTDPNISEDGQVRHIKMLTQILSKEKNKNDIFKKTITKLIFRELTLKRILSDKIEKNQIASYTSFDQIEPKKTNKLKKVFLTVYFIEILKRKQRNTIKIKQKLNKNHQQHINQHKLDKKINYLCLHFEYGTVQNEFYEQMLDYLNKHLTNEGEIENKIIDLINFTHIKIKNIDDSLKLALKVKPKMNLF